MLNGLEIYTLNLFLKTIWIIAKFVHKIFRDGLKLKNENALVGKLKVLTNIFLRFKGEQLLQNVF